jgi:hypothetical protein
VNFNWIKRPEPFLNPFSLSHNEHRRKPGEQACTSASLPKKNAKKINIVNRKPNMSTEGLGVVDTHVLLGDEGDAAELLGNLPMVHVAPLDELDEGVFEARAVGV